MILSDEMANKHPYHIAIIPDGNRRFAKRLMKKPWKGHEWGMEKIKSVLEWSRENNVKTVTIYSLSLENIERRPRKELEYLYDISRKEMKDIIENNNNFIHKYRAKINFMGETERLPEDIQELILKIMQKTHDYNNLYLNIAIAYGGKQEITHAVKAIAKKVKRGEIDPDKIDEDTINNNLFNPGFPDPDIIIRTGGEKRLSNFLSFQSAYSELIFIERLWPEFLKEDFISAIEEYERRKRRFGA